MENVRLFRAIASALVAGTILLGTLPGFAQAKEITPRSAVPALENLKKYYEVKNFKIGGKYDLDKPDSWANGGEGGTTLESLGAGPLRLSYIAVGTPKRDHKGEITNAIIVSTYYSGDSTAMYAFWQQGGAYSKLPFSAVHVGPGQLFDTNRFYVVYLDALGLWGSSKPSDGLGMKFPKYNMFDLVQANYRLLRDHLKIGQVQLAAGPSMGGTQSYVWGLLHSNDGFVKAIMPIGGTTSSAGEDPVGEWTFQLMTAAIESDPVWQKTKGNYYHLPKSEHPNQGVAFGWSMLSQTGFTLDYRASLPWASVEPEVFSWDSGPKEGASQKSKAAVFDAVDLYYRNTIQSPLAMNKELHRIKARTLVMHIATDQWLIDDLAKKSAERISGAQYATMADKFAHYAIFKAPATLKSDPLVDGFFRDIGLIADPQRMYVAKNYRSPKVVMTGNSQSSFWKTQVTYPFPVKFAKGRDAKGVNWDIGYMDEYNGTEKNPQTLVLIHGKGAFGAHYGYLIKYALERGLRVVVPDLPHYGMSGPGNLDKSPARTMDQMREAIHDVVVNKLNVKNAWYFGHSLGGQLVMGYALKYPGAVRGLVLEGPAGLEEYPRGALGMNLFDSAYGSDFEKWKTAWTPLNLLEPERNKTPQQIVDFFNWKGPKGYFKVNTEYARLHTDQRVAIISNPAERDQYVNAFIYDVWAMINESLVEDPNSLRKRLNNIKVPIFLTYGAQEPFIPGTALNGWQSLAKDVVVPFKRMMTAAGNPPVTKIYPNAGHFIHTDRPYEFSRDVVDFIKTGKVDSVSDEVIVAVMEGAPASVTVAGAAPAAAKPAGLSK